MADSTEHRKARGAFFTPPAICEFLTDWAIRDLHDRIFEPSCGEAAFLTSAVSRFRALGSTKLVKAQISGVDIFPDSVDHAQKVLLQQGIDGDLKTANFFDIHPAATFDAIIGNPPYIRYQQFSGDARAKGRAAALAQGIRLDGLSSSWAPFVIHASAFLKPLGRLGLVLPAELLSVNYAAPVRNFLLQRFSDVRLVLFEKRVFPGVLEEVVLLLAEGEGPTDHFKVLQARDLSSLQRMESTPWFPGDVDQKWTSALLPPDVSRTYTSSLAVDSFATLSEWGGVDLGMVTGNNKYFTLDRDAVRRLGLRESELLRISPPGSRHLRGLAITEKGWEELRNQGRPTFLFRPNPRNPSRAALRYIEEGESNRVQDAYKCKVRKPWWAVPQVPVPDLFLTYMNHDTPRLVTNRARLGYLNSVHGMVLRRGLKQLGMDLLPLAALNSITLLGSEVVGRAYGGGMLKLEPTEAARLPVPSPDLVQRVAPELRALRPQLARFLRAGSLMEAVRAVDRIVLMRGMRLRASDIDLLREGREILFSRRVARGKA